MKLVTRIAFILACSGGSLVQAASVDLSSWISNDRGAATWNVQNPANDSVLQTRNGNPTVFFEKGANAQGTALSGNIKVTTTSDDDFIGFVLGYEDGELSSSSTDFMLIDWKQGNQNSAACGGPAARGLSISRVTNSSSPCSYWNHAAGAVDEVKRATNLGDTGWLDNTGYAFELTFTASLIEVLVDNVLEISLTAAEAGLTAFDDGAFGFYNYSQGNVLYSAITEDPVIVPPSNVSEPATFAIWGAGLIGLVVSRRRSRLVS